MTVEVRAEENERARHRCPFCHDVLRESDPTIRCPKCETAYHTACSRELPRCAVMGCRAELRRATSATSKSEVDAPETVSSTTVPRLLAFSMFVLFAVSTVLAFMAGVNARHEREMGLGLGGAFVLLVLTATAFLAIFDPEQVFGPRIRRFLGSASRRRGVLGVSVALFLSTALGVITYAASSTHDPDQRFGFFVAAVVLVLLVLLALVIGLASSERGEP